MNAISLVAYLALFATVAFLFVFVALLLGRFLRPNVPTPAKAQTYECGEPSIGSSFVQFDLRFYVVALVFLIFDVEVSFFFPWATVYGTAIQLMDSRGPEAAAKDSSPRPNDLAGEKLQALGIPQSRANDRSAQRQPSVAQIQQSARQLALMSMADVGAFFAVLLVGFAYVWKRGDLDWVRASGRGLPRPDEDLETAGVS